MEETGWTFLRFRMVAVVLEKLTLPNNRCYHYVQLSARIQRREIADTVDVSFVTTQLAT